MSRPDRYQILLCSTQEEYERGVQIRIEVFVEEQKFTMEDELDEKDPGSDHLLLIDTETNKDMGMIRWYPPMGKLGRLAVRKEYRGIGAGRWLVEALDEHLRSRKGKGGVANEGKDEVLIVANAQIYAEKFYNKCGFVGEGEPFIEDGAPHLRMVKTLKLS